MEIKKEIEELFLKQVMYLQIIWINLNKKK